MWTEFISTKKVDALPISLLSKIFCSFKVVHFKLNLYPKKEEGFLYCQTLPTVNRITVVFGTR